MALPGGRFEEADPGLLHTAMRETLEETGGNKSEAARVLQISRPTLNRIIQDHRLAVS